MATTTLAARKRAGLPPPNDTVPAYLTDNPICHLLTLDHTQALSNTAHIHLPSSWNLKDKNPLISVSTGGLQAEYTGPGHSDNDAAAVRSNTSIPNCLGIYYYEVTIVNQGRDGYIGIGLSQSQVPLNRLPGWEPGSWGYHGDDGHIFINSGTGIKYGPTFGTADVIGCGLDSVNGTLFFTKNGIHLGNAVQQAGFPPTKLFPSIGMRTPNESVLANFGALPFVFNVTQYVNEQRTALFQKHILGDLDVGSGVYLDLVMDYLVFHGYLNTVDALFRHLGADGNRSSCKYVDLDPNEVLEEMRSRRQICQLIEHGNIERAYDLILSSHDPVDATVAFEIECQIFIERIRDQSMSALKYGRDTLVRWLDFIDDAYIQTKLKQIMLLLAYPDPKAAPTEDPILDVSQRYVLAEHVNAYLLLHRTTDSHRPALELAARQLRVSMELVATSAAKGGPAPLIDWVNQIFGGNSF